MPRVSIVIPAYNSARFLRETIESVLGQSFQDFEVIVVDDGSRDNTREVVAGIKDARIRYIYQENRGVSAARNHGFKIARGEYINFLDSDDVLLKETLKKSVEVLDSHREVGFSYGEAWIMEENGQIYRIRKSSFQNDSGIVDRELQIRELLYIPMITMSTLMARCECVEEIGGFNEAINNISEDEHLFIRIAKKYPIYYIAEPLVKYRIHANQLHNKLSIEEAKKAFNQILGEIFDDPQLAPQFQKWRRKSYCRAYLMSAGYAYGKNMALARTYIRKGLKTYPQVMLQEDGINMVYKYLASFIPVPLWSNLRELKWRLKSASLLDKE